MGLLTDAPMSTRREDGKFLKLFRTLDEEDRAMIRRWDEDPMFPVSEIHRRLKGHFDISRSTVERGLEDLRESEWEC